ncbi:unnamed protein product [Adineta ricciae]|nr:unnamed protein product [Adineta ricciae]CAF1076490.1 unnamed protein product [Adineta ricciae]
MTTSETLYFVSQQLNIYWGLTMFILGIIGAIWNILTFHHHTLRSSSYCTYLRFASVASLIQILFSLSDRIIYAGFDIPWTATNVAWCKIRYFSAHCTSLNALSFLVFSAIDRFFSTCDEIKWRRLNCASVAKRVCIFTIVFWTILTIPTLVYAKPVQIKLNRYSCENTSWIWSQIAVFFFSLCCYGIFPWFFMSLFGFLTWKNLRRIHHRRICIASSGIVTRKARIDDQLASMLFLQIFICILSSIPFCSQNIYSSVTRTMDKTELRQAQEYLYLQIARLAFYFNYISTFYVNYLSSAIFRQVSRQVLRNLFKNKENLSRQATMVNH